MDILPSLATSLLAAAPRDPVLYGKVGVLMGGYAEYDVSLQSGAEVLKALLAAKVDAHEVLVRPDNHWLEHLIAQKFDRVFIALHGTKGEDGTVQGALDILGIPYTGCKVCASAVAMNKLVTKQIWKSLDLPTLPFIHLQPDFDAAAIVRQFGLPLAVKPASSGSTIGVSKVKKEEELKSAYELALQYDNTVIVEPWVTGNGAEYAVPVLAGWALPSIRIEPKQEFYDYTAKYMDDNTGFFCPSGLSPEEEKALRALGEAACQSLGCTEMARADFLRDATGKFWAMEVNTIPGLTTHSLLPRSVKALGYQFDDLVLTVLAATL